MLLFLKWIGCFLLPEWREDICQFQDITKCVPHRVLKKWTYGKVGSVQQKCQLSFLFFFFTFSLSLFLFLSYTPSYFQTSLSVSLTYIIIPYCFPYTLANIFYFSHTHVHIFAIYHTIARSPQTHTHTDIFPNSCKAPDNSNQTQCSQNMDEAEVIEWWSKLKQ